MHKWRQSLFLLLVFCLLCLLFVLIVLLRTSFHQVFRVFFPIFIHFVLKSLWQIDSTNITEAYQVWENISQLLSNMRLFLLRKLRKSFLDLSFHWNISVTYPIYPNIAITKFLGVWNECHSLSSTNPLIRSRTCTKSEILHF